MAKKPINDKRRGEYFDEDFVEGAIRSLQRSIMRIQWRTSAGEWPDEPVGKYRHLMEDHIEKLIKDEVERHRRGEVTAKKRMGPVIHSKRRGRERMTPKK